MNKSKTKSNASEFIEGLLEIAAEISSVADDGTPITNGEQLRRQIWKTALGYDETAKDDKGNVRTIKHPPASWAQEFLYSMIVGRPAAMTVEKPRGLTAVDKVSDLVRDRLNAIAKESMGTAMPASTQADDSGEESNRD